MKPSMIHSFEYLHQPIEVVITQLQSGQHAGSFVIKVLVKTTGREVTPSRANDLTFFNDLVAAQTAGETLGKRLLDASRDGHRFRSSETSRTR